MTTNHALIAQYATWLKAGARAEGTIRLRVHYLRRLAAVGDLRAVTGPDLVGWFASHHWGPQTKKSARSSLVGFFSWCQATGHRTDNPARALPTVIVPRAVPRPAPGVALARALAAASDRDRIMVMLAAYAGLRRSEIAALTWADIIDGPAVRVVGKGGHSRVVPLLPDLSEALAAEQEHRAHGRVGTGWRVAPDPSSPFVFPSARGGHLRADTVGSILHRLLGHGEWTGHTLRHRFASRAYAGTRDLRAVQELLGHSKPETTAGYVAVASASMVAAVAAAA